MAQGHIFPKQTHFKHSHQNMKYIFVIVFIYFLDHVIYMCSFMIEHYLNCVSMFIQTSCGPIIPAKIHITQINIVYDWIAD